MILDRANEQPIGNSNPGKMKVDGAGSLGTHSLVEKVEELPYEGKTMGSDTKTDAQGMKLEGESGAGAQFQDQQVDDSGNAE